MSDWIADFLAVSIQSLAFVKLGENCEQTQSLVCIESPKLDPNERKI